MTAQPITIEQMQDPEELNSNN